MLEIQKRSYPASLKESIIESMGKYPVEGNFQCKVLFLWWLGQAGFAFQYSSILFLIDPYLSDSLAKKYKDKELPHRRLMAAPILPDEVSNLDFVLCSHRHSDHMDPETLPVLAENNKNCKFILPEAHRKYAFNLGLPEDRIIGMNAQDTIKLKEGCTVTAVASAHEELMQNEAGEHCYLGYIIRFDSIALYHSGDCVPFTGLAEELLKHHIDIALLPINGRDQYRRKRNIAGNFTVSEAIELCKNARIPILMGHHFELFDFNTIDRTDAQREFMQNALNKGQEPSECLLPEISIKYVVTKAASTGSIA